ncbi:MAG: hypothetical protein HY565_00665 [Candidatus Kerfeldbacteria bacterium]|nr:hypothetical protein [Candidatus Kerfeldbacteria bacterium]
MPMKRFFHAISSGICVLSLALPTWAGTIPTATSYDYGDAPDGASTSYGNGATGAFPSLEASNGARTLTVDEVWLGQTVTSEKDSKQVDQDKFDDGVDLKLKACATSKAVFLVQVENPGEMSGTAYLNLFADWDKNGQWAGSDACADEWAVRNFPVDLSAQTKTITAYVPAFMAGENVKNIWFRAVVTKDQRLYDETGAGTFTSGEVEDYGPSVPGDGGSYGVNCRPNPLIMQHGDAGKITIVEKPGTKAFSHIDFPNSSDPNGDGVYKDKSKKVSISGLDEVTVKSRQKHSATVETVAVEVSVRYPDGTRIIKTCPVYIVHKTLAAVDQDSHDYTLTEFDPSRVYFTDLGSDTTVMRTVISPRATETIPTEMVALQLVGFEVPLDHQYPALPDPVDVDLDINGLGWPTDWSCDIVTNAFGEQVKRCEGSTTLMTCESSFSIYFSTTALKTLSDLHLHLLTADGQTLAVDMPLGE